MTMSLWRIITIFFSALLLIFVDFSTKAYCYYLLPMHISGLDGIVIFNNILGIKGSLNLAFNRGAAWGLLANMQIPLLIVRIGVILTIICYLFFKEKQVNRYWPWMLICAGAIGNVIDFFTYGYVVDFIQLNLWGFHFPLFNFADTLITIGAIWLFFLSKTKKEIIDERCQVDQTTRPTL